MKPIFTLHQTIQVNYNDHSLPENVRRMKPAVWKEDGVFCVLSGSDSSKGIFGCVITLDGALQDWNRHLVEKRSYGEMATAYLPSTYQAA